MAEAVQHSLVPCPQVRHTEKPIKSRQVASRTPYRAQQGYSSGCIRAPDGTQLCFNNTVAGTMTAQSCGEECLSLRV